MRWRGSCHRSRLVGRHHRLPARVWIVGTIVDVGIDSIVVFKLRVAEGDAGGDEAIAAGGMALREEEVEIIEPINLHTGRFRNFIKTHGLGLGTVNAAQINGQVSIEKEPDIVVARKSENLAAGIGESRVDHKREMVIVREAFVSVEFTVDGEECVVSVGVHIG